MSYGSPQQPHDGQGGAAANPYGQQYAQQSQATVALVVAIVGLVCCALAAPVGLFMGKKEVDAIDQGLVDPAERGKAKAAFIIGIVGCVVLVLWLFYVLLAVALG